MFIFLIREIQSEIQVSNIGKEKIWFIQSFCDNSQPM